MENQKDCSSVHSDVDAVRARFEKQFSIPSSIVFCTTEYIPKNRDGEWSLAGIYNNLFRGFQAGLSSQVGWISVDDANLPKRGQLVLGYWNEQGLPYTLTRFNGVGYWIDEFGDERFNNPSFWMPIPPSPKE